MSWTGIDSCTLPSEEQPLRQAEFDALFADTLDTVERTSGESLRLHLRGPEGTEERVRDLAAREGECCSFFSFGVERLTPDDGSDQEQVALEIAVPPSRATLLDVLASRATSQSASAVALDS